MLRVNLRNAKPGMVLAMPARHPAAVNLVLLKIDYQLDPASIKRLREIGVRMVWVRYPALNCLDKFISPMVIERENRAEPKVLVLIELILVDLCLLDLYGNHPAGSKYSKEFDG